MQNRATGTACYIRAQYANWLFKVHKPGTQAATGSGSVRTYSNVGWLHDMETWKEWSKWWRIASDSVSLEEMRRGSARIGVTNKNKLTYHHRVDPTRSPQSWFNDGDEWSRFSCVSQTSSCQIFAYVTLYWTIGFACFSGYVALVEPDHSDCVRNASIWMLRSKSWWCKVLSVRRKFVGR